MASISHGDGDSTVTRQLPDRYQSHHTTTSILNYNYLSVHSHTFAKLYFWSNSSFTRALQVINKKPKAKKEKDKKEKDKKTKRTENRPGSDRTSEIEPTRQDMASISHGDGYPTVINHIT
jgi:hypothetical protein